MRYFFVYTLLIICCSCISGNNSIFAPSGLYNDIDSSTILVADNGSMARIVRLTKGGDFVGYCNFADQRVNDLIINGNKIAVVSGTFNGKLTIIDSKTFKIEKDIVVGHTPSSILFNDGYYWITLRHNNKLICVDSKTLTITDEISVGREPNDMVKCGDNLIITNNLPEQSALDYPIAANIKIVSLNSRKLIKTIALPNGSTDVRSITIDADGYFAYTTHLVARYQLPTNQVDRGWMCTNALSIIDLKNLTLYSTVLLDTPQRGAANPAEVIVSKDNKTILVALSGSHELAIIDRYSLHNKLERYQNGVQLSSSSREFGDIVNDASFLYGIREFIATNGNGTRSICQAGDDIYGSNYFSGEIFKLESTNKVANIYASGRSLLETKIGRGEAYFHDATLCFQQWQSCASCHPNDARVDGLNWDLLNDGIGNLKNSKSLLYSHQTPPAMVTGVRPSAEVAVSAGFKYIFFTEVEESVVDDVNSYLSNLRHLKSPYLTQECGLSAKALKGKELFDKYCLSCHSGRYYTDQKQYLIEWSNPKEHNIPMDVTTLIEVWRTAPYLYDGRAYSMGEMLRIHTPKDRLTDSELSQLEEYIMSL